MIADLLNNFFTHLTLFDVVKTMFMLGLLVYLAFAIIIIRQVSIMNEALESPNNSLVAAFAWVHLVLTILLLTMTFIFL